MVINKIYIVHKINYLHKMPMFTIGKKGYKLTEVARFTLGVVPRSTLTISECPLIAARWSGVFLLGSTGSARYVVPVWLART